MVKDFYNDEAPMPFRDVVEGEMEVDPEVPGHKKHKAIFTGGLLGPMGYPVSYPIGYPDGPMYPFIMGPTEDYEEEDPNP